MTTSVIPVLLTWSGLFGLHHLMAYRRAPAAKGHLSGFVMNLVPFLWAGIILIVAS